MLEEIIEDNLQRISAQGHQVFRTDTNYEDLLKLKQEATKEWADFNEDVKTRYASKEKFEEEKGVRDLKDPDLIPAKNLYLVRKEVRLRIEAHDLFQLLPLEALDFDESALELAESLENVVDIREIYRIRKQATGNSKNAGISAEEAVKLKNCFSQGRELYLAGKQGSLMVKPLNFFYSLTAYAYGAIILNHPLKYRKDMIQSSHGMTYVAPAIQAQFGGDSPRGTFSDLVTADPTHSIKTNHIAFDIDCSASIMEFYNNRFNVTIGTLLSMIPEMSDYYKLTTGKNSRCHRIEVVSVNDPRNVVWDFHIGDGEVRPSAEGIESAFKGFHKAERYGKTVITVPASQAFSIKACIYTDIRGNLWYIDNPFFPVILPEIAVHFLISSMFSNIMRYRPEEWGYVLLNEVPSKISLITRHYFSSFQRKFFVVILRSLSRYIPYAIP